jgi:hypothetical protein
MKRFGNDVFNIREWFSEITLPFNENVLYGPGGVGACDYQSILCFSGWEAELAASVERL